MLATVRTTLSLLSSRERAKFVALVVARALTGLLDVAGIALIGLVASIAATQIQNDATPVAVLGFSLPQLNGQGLLVLVAIVLGVFTVKGVAASLLIRAQARFVARVEARNASQAIAYLLSGNLDVAKQYSKADFQFAVTRSMTFAFTGILNNIATFVAEGFLLLVITATFFAVDPAIAVFALGYFAAIIVVIQLFISRSLKRAGRDATDGAISTMNGISDTLDTFREISVLEKQGHFIERITRDRRRLANADATMTFLAGMPRYVVETALMLGVVILVAQLVTSGGLATGLVAVGVFLAGGVRMMASLLPLQSAVSNIKQNVEQAGAALRLLAAVPVTARAEVPFVAVEVALSVELADVTFSYPGAATASVSGVTLAVPAGGYAAIVGPSGAGKTTIVDLVLGLREPTQGTVTVGGVAPRLLRAARPGLVAYVPQRPGMVSGSIAENIALGIPVDEIDAERLRQAVDAAYLRDFIDSLPEGLDTSVGQQVDALSGGQIQRVGLARALYSSPQVLILDEATSGLDAGSEAYISKTLAGLHGTVTVIVVAHRLSTVQHADVVYVIENGTVRASGDFTTVRREVPMIEEYVKLMSFDTEVAKDADD